jgi:hypothetical protein
MLQLKSKKSKLHAISLLYVEGKLKEEDYEYIEKRVCDKGQFQ